MLGPAATSDVVALYDALCQMYAELDGRDETIAQKDADIIRLNAIIAQKDALLAEFRIRRAAPGRADACHNSARLPSSTRPGRSAEGRREAEEQNARNPNRRPPPDRAVGSKCVTGKIPVDGQPERQSPASAGQGVYTAGTGAGLAGWGSQAPQAGEVIPAGS